MFFLTVSEYFCKGERREESSGSSSFPSGEESRSRVRDEFMKSGVGKKS